MNALKKYYLKTFLWLGVSFGLIMTLFDILEGDGFHIGKVLFLSVPFGGIMSITLVSIHKIELKKQGITEFTEENLSSFQRRVVRSKIGINELITRLKSDSIFGSMKFKVSGTELKLRSKITWFSWGEKIRITLLLSIDNEFEYEIMSSPKASTTIVDYGKNLDNVNRVETLLNNIV